MCPQNRSDRRLDLVWSDVVISEEETAVCSKCEVVIHELVIRTSSAWHGLVCAAGTVSDQQPDAPALV